MNNQTATPEPIGETKQTEEDDLRTEEIMGDRQSKVPSVAGNRTSALTNRAMAVDEVDDPAVKRVNLNIPAIAYREAVASAKKKGWTLTQFVLFALGLAVQIVEETAKGGRLFLKTSGGEREFFLPRY